MNESRESNSGPKHWSLLTFALAWDFGKAVVRDVRLALRSRRRAIARPSLSRSPDGQRSGDRDLDPRRETAAHRRWGTFLVFCSFAVAVAAGIWFLFVYWTTANHMLLGAAMAVFWGGIGVCLILYARWLMLDVQACEPREIVPSKDAERAAFAADLREGAGEIQRRGLLAWIAVSAVGFATAVRRLPVPIARRRSR